MKSNLLLIGGWGETSVALQMLASALPECRTTSPYDLLAGNGVLKADDKTEPSAYVSTLLDMFSGQRRGLVGYSMGGMIALEFAHFYPELVDKIILISSTACFCAHENDGYLCGAKRAEVRALALSLKRRKDETIRSFFSRTYTANNSVEIVEAKVKRAESADLRVLLHGLDYLLEKDYRRLVSGIRQKTLILHGADDRVIPKEASEYLHCHLPSSILTILNGGSHGICEEKAEEVVSAIRSFLRDE